MQKTLLILTLNLSLLFLSGCGSSGGDTILSPAPTEAPTTVTLSVSGPRFIQFNWNFVPQADHFALLENHGGSSELVSIPTAGYIQDFKYSLDCPLLWTDWTNKLFGVSACNVNDTIQHSSSPITVSDSVVTSAIGYFKASNTDAFDYFGNSVALSADGSTLAVGAYQEDSNAQRIQGNTNNDSSSQSGAVYLY